MKVVTSEQMREADRITIERGTPGQILMERAGERVVEMLKREFPPLKKQRVVIFCGKGNNGGDGLVVARLLEGRVKSLQVVRATSNQSRGDSKDLEIDHKASIVVDALLGTGLEGPVRGRYKELIRAINEDFPKAKVVAVDIPSAMQVSADITVTFAAPKVEMLLGESAENVGKLVVADIGIPADALKSDLNLSEAGDFKKLLAPRKADANKGNFGHVLVVGGATGKAGAAAMSGLAALKAGAGLVTVACADDSRLALELMWQPLDGIHLEKMTVLAIGPGLGVNRELVERLVHEANIPTVIDADALNVIAKEFSEFRGRGIQTILTPHPGEMGRLIGSDGSVKDADRLTVARRFATERDCCLVLKGHRTLIAFPDGQVWINPTGSPAMAKGGSGDILTGLVAGFVAQFPEDIATAVRAAVWLHGRAGEIGAEEVTDKCLLATDLLHYLPRAIHECI